MATTASQRQVYQDLLDRYGRLTAEAFLQAIEDLKSAAEVQRIIAAYQAGDIEGALEALHIEPEVFSDLLDSMRNAYTAGGKSAVEMMPARRPDGTALVVRFDGRALEAERWLAGSSSNLITRITAEQRDNAREALRASMEKGQGPRAAALDLVGRMDRTTGKRVGGIIGLSAPQAEYVRTARLELASGDPALLKNYLARKRRDKRFDRSVTKAIADEKPVPAEILGKAAVAYERRLLQLRGETIGRVETMTALQKGKRQAYEQAIAAGKISEADVRKAWRSAGDLRVRHTHVMLNGDSAAFNEAFVSASGARLQYPMDTSLGAGMDEIAGCRCDAEYRIDFYANLR